MKTRWKLDEQTVRRILRRIDSGLYTQSEIAKEFGVTQGTISNYNRIARFRIKDADNAKIIISLNEQVAYLQDKLNIPKVISQIPDSFNETFISCRVTHTLEDICKKISGEYVSYVEGESIDERHPEIELDSIHISGYSTLKRDDAIEFMKYHPEYHMYTIKSTKKRYNYRHEMTSSGRDYKNYICFLTLADLGFIPSFKPIDLFYIEEKKISK